MGPININRGWRGGKMLQKLNFQEDKKLEIFFLSILRRETDFINAEVPMMPRRLRIF